MATLLSFHKEVLEKMHDPSTSELLLIARGLGLRRIICKLLQIYESPQNLVLLVNASPEEESAIGAELGLMGCRNPGLRIVGFETGRKERFVNPLSRLLWSVSGIYIHKLHQTGVVQERRPAFYHISNLNRRYVDQRHSH